MSRYPDTLMLHYPVLIFYLKHSHFEIQTTSIMLGSNTITRHKESTMQCLKNAPKSIRNEQVSKFLNFFISLSKSQKFVKENAQFFENMTFGF